MKWELETGKVINIPDKEIDKLMKTLDIEEGEAIDLWLSDNNFEENEEQEQLDKTAKKVKISHGAGKREKEKKSRTVKISEQKQWIFDIIKSTFDNIDNINYTILTENKLLELEFDGLKFKLDLIQQRTPKK